MNTPNKGDILAERINSILALYAPIEPRIFAALKSAFAEYCAPLPDIADPYAALKKAHAEGKVIQYNHGGLEPEWVDEPNPRWNEPVARYRVKPEPEMVELGPEDVPPGSVAQRIDAECKSSHLTIQLHQGIGEPIVENQLISFGKLRKHYLIHRPGTLTADGKPMWVKCEKPANEEAK